MATQRFFVSRRHRIYRGNAALLRLLRYLHRDFCGTPFAAPRRLRHAVCSTASFATDSSVFIAPVFIAPVFSETVFSETVFSESVFSESVFCVPVFCVPVFFEPVYFEFLFLSQIRVFNMSLCL